MNNALVKNEVKLPEFGINYVFDLLNHSFSSGKIGKEEYDKLVSNYPDTLNDFLIGLIHRNNYIMIDGKDCGNLFANVNYMVGFYVWHNKFELDYFISRMWKPFELFKEAEIYYFEFLKSINDKILKLEEDNKIEMYPLNAFFERLRATAERYKNLVGETIFDLQFGYGVLEDRKKKFLYFGKFEGFDLLSNTETDGFVNFINAIEELECQFEFFDLFSPFKIKRVYDNLLFDVVVGVETKPQKYTNLLRPVLQQFLFCTEYSEDAVKLSLKKEDVFFVFEDLRIKYLKNFEKVREFYKASNEKIMEVISSSVERSNISNFYQDKLYNVTSCFFYDKKTFGDEFKVADKEVFARAVSHLKSMASYLKYKDITDEIISKLMEEETKYFYTEEGIDISYLDYLKKSLVNNESFKSLSDKTKEYILKNIPDVRNSLMAFFLYNKNISFYVE